MAFKRGCSLRALPISSYFLFWTSNLARSGPAIAPTMAKRAIAAPPAMAAERLNPPIAKVAKRFIEVGQGLAFLTQEVYLFSKQWSVV